MVLLPDLDSLVVAAGSKSGPRLIEADGPYRGLVTFKGREAAPVIVFLVEEADGVVIATGCQDL